MGLEHRHVVIATGARWTKMLYSTLEFPVGELDGPGVYTPDDLAGGAVPQGPVVVFDFDNYYLGGAIAQQLAMSGGEVTYVTPAGNASAWTFMTNELPLVHRALVQGRVPIHTLQRVTAFDGDAATLADVYSGKEKRLACRSLVIVGVRAPRDELYQALIAKGPELKEAGIAGVTRIGDAFAPGAIVHAVHSGHRYAREFDTAPAAAPYARDYPSMNAAQLEPTLPSSWYRSAEVFRTEKERIFCREWIGVCREEELAGPGRLSGARRARREHLAGAQSRGPAAGLLQCVPASRLPSVQNPRRNAGHAGDPSRRNHRRPPDRVSVPSVVL